MNWSLNIESHCERVASQGLTCMICEQELAVGHTRVGGGGPFDGRLLLIHCQTCVPPVHDPIAIRRVKGSIVTFVMLGWIDPHTGGPGPEGEPALPHGDHYDPWPAFPDNDNLTTEGSP
jgi:hypothetical protein